MVVSAYRPPNNSAIIDVTNLDKIIAFKNQISQCKLVIGGDFNARHQDWRNPIRCNSGTALANWISTNGVFLNLQLVFSAEPTYYKGNYTSHLDFFVISDECNIIFPVITPNMLSILDYPSDHRAVELIIDLQCSPIRSQPIVFPNFNQVDWKLFNRTIDAGISEINISNNCNMTTFQIDTAVQDITLLINDTVDKVVPKATIRNRMTFSIPHDLQHIINEKNRLRRIWQRLRYDHNAYRLRSVINNLEKIIRDRLMFLQTNHWQHALSNIKLDNHCFSNIRNFAKSKRLNTIHSLQVNPTSTALTSDSKEKAGILGRHYEAVHRQNNLLGDTDFTNTVTRYVQDTTPD